MRMLQIDVHGIARSDEKMATLFFFHLVTFQKIAHMSSKVVMH